MVNLFRHGVANHVLLSDTFRKTKIGLIFSLLHSRFDLIDVPAEARELLVEMSRLVGPNLHAECDGNVTEVVETPIVLYISVKSALLTLDWSTDEQYVLDVQTKGNFDQVFKHLLNVWFCTVSDTI